MILKYSKDGNNQKLLLNIIDRTSTLKRVSPPLDCDSHDDDTQDQKGDNENNNQSICQGGKEIKNKLQAMPHK